MTASALPTAFLVLAFALLGSAKVAAVPAMRTRAEHVGFSVGSYRRIGVLELLGVTGLLVGLAVPQVGVLAAAGLLALLCGAVATHVRSGDGRAEIAPAAVLAVVCLAYVVLAVGQLS